MKKIIYILSIIILLSCGKDRKVLTYEVNTNDDYILLKYQNYSLYSKKKIAVFSGDVIQYDLQSENQNDVTANIVWYVNGEVIEQRNISFEFPIQSAIYKFKIP